MVIKHPKEFNEKNFVDIKGDSVIIPPNRWELNGYLHFSAYYANGDEMLVHFCGWPIMSERV
jgi:hypothetical protein